MTNRARLPNPADQIMDLGDPGQIVADPTLGPHPTIGTHHTHIVMLLGPINPDEQFHLNLPAR